MKRDALIKHREIQTMFNDDDIDALGDEIDKAIDSKAETQHILELKIYRLEKQIQRLTNSVYQVENNQRANFNSLINLLDEVSR